MIHPLIKNRHTSAFYFIRQNFHQKSSFFVYRGYHNGLKKPYRGSMISLIRLSIVMLRENLQVFLKCAITPIARATSDVLAVTSLAFAYDIL